MIKILCLINRFREDVSWVLAGLHMEPISTRFVAVLKKHLIDMRITFQYLDEPPALGLGASNIGRTAVKVCARGGTADTGINGWASVARIYNYGLADFVAKRLQD